MIRSPTKGIPSKTIGSTRGAARLPSEDEELYEHVAGEVARGDVRPGLWAKAFSEAIGDENATRATYLRLRVDQLREEEREAASAAALAHEEQQRRLQEEKLQRARAHSEKQIRRATLGALAWGFVIVAFALVAVGAPPFVFLCAFAVAGLFGLLNWARVRPKG